MNKETTMDICVRCGHTVDLSAEVAGYEYLYRFIFDNSENSDAVVCHPCVTHDEAKLVWFLVEGGYDSLPEWGWDSNYARFADGMWRDEAGAMVDLLGHAVGAMEVSQ